MKILAALLHPLLPAAAALLIIGVRAARALVALDLDRKGVDSP